MNARAEHLEPAPAVVSSADRLGFTLFIACVLHLALILGVSFSVSEPGQLSKTLEITLSTFKSEEKPKDADFLAQDNQQGSGTLEHKAAPTTKEKPLFQDSELKPVATPAAPPPPPPQEATPAPSKAAPVVTTRAPQPQQAAIKKEQEEVRQQPPTPHFDRERLSAEIASLEAVVAQEEQQYAKRPRTLRLNAASTMRDKGAWYKDDWRKKIERVGNQNYPEEARRQRIYGNLRLLVTIRRDGTLEEVQLIESSGQPLLDQAALRIVRLAAPFAPFTGDMQEYDRLEIIRTWRFERGDRLHSE
jgi:protein TonB